MLDIHQWASQESGFTAYLNTIHPSKPRAGMLRSCPRSASKTSKFKSDLF